MPTVILLFFWLVADPFSGWETLSKLKLVPAYDEFLGEDREAPVFSSELQAFEGQFVTLEGYVIPIEKSGVADYFVLSRFPYNSCFFCGNAGPETVAEVYLKEKMTFQDQKVRVTGQLHLNSGDPFHLFFIFKECEVIVLD